MTYNIPYNFSFLHCHDKNTPTYFYENMQITSECSKKMYRNGISFACKFVPTDAIANI